MRALSLARKPHGHCEIDLCDACHALWFDAFESVALTPESTLALFREVHGAAAPAREGLPTHMPCPRCRASLADTHDMQRNTRFRYWRCPRGHGRFTPFMHFLREKDFVRPLSAAEIMRLKAHIRTIRCTGCGAPIELARDMVCRYCRAPIEALDPDAIQANIATLSSAAAKRKSIDVDALADAILGSPSGPRPHEALAVYPPVLSSPIDLVGAGIELIVDGFEAG